jgi:hypothetical protein
MELMKRDFLTVTDEGENICMSLDTAHEDVQKVGKKMAEIRTGLKMDGKGWEAFLKYYLDANNPALLKDLIWNSEGDDLNDILEFGVYAIPNEETAKTLLHAPSERAGRLVVCSADGSGGARILQEYINDTGERYSRLIDGEMVGEWKQ